MQATETKLSASGLAQREDSTVARGRLRIYFGACSGIGKRRAMLLAAQKWQAGGKSVLVHTAATGEDNSDGEFALDAALERRPALLLLDDLAHRNAPGTRHPMRWQDVEELLGAGIDVYTTLNVQELESLNDVVTEITGIKMADTVPDTIFDLADEVVLVDVPEPGEVQAQLRTGAGPAKLGALRELAMRRAADRLENGVQAYRAAESVRPLWKTNAGLLVCVGPHADAGHVVRTAAQLATQLNSDWHAIYIETPRLQRMPADQRVRILQTLKLAQSLGATSSVVEGSDIGHAIAEYARSQNFGKIVMGRTEQAWRWPWQGSYARRVALHVPEIDLIEIGRSASANQADASVVADANENETSEAPTELHDASRRHRYLLAAGASLLTALVSIPLLPYFELANIAMLFLLTVVLVAVRFGREASVVATMVGVVAIGVASPRFAFDIGGLQYAVTFMVMLSVGLITGSLTAGLRYQARVAMQREARTRALYEFARTLSGTLRTEQVIDSTRLFVQRTFAAHATLLLPDFEGRLRYPAPGQAAHAQHLSVLDMAAAQWAFDRATPAGAGTETLPSNTFFYLPLVAPMRARGVLALKPEHGRWMVTPDQRKQLDAFAALAAIALERVHYVEVAQEAMVSMESERLRNALLAALSHDLRTPLTSLVGLSESLAISKPPLAPQQLEIAEALRDESIRLSRLVANLLDMARIQSGSVRLNLQWQAVEELVGSALRASRAQLSRHQVQTRIGPALPLVRFDAVLMERVLCNLLENAAKYTPPGSRITIESRAADGVMELIVRDNGPGLPLGKEDAIFEKFARGERESAIPGVGLGLAICRAIVDAHDGAIRARNADGAGASFIITLPLGTPPAIHFPDESDNQTTAPQSI